MDHKCLVESQKPKCGRIHRFLLVIAIAAIAIGAAAQPPIALHPDNPHYFLWRGEPTVLITSAEHYGAVLNRDFDYALYLKTLQSLGHNLTRTFSGAYCEPPGAFNIRHNTLAPAENRLICPWARSDDPGYANGGNKFDLTKWDPAYFERLREFVAEAGRRGVVVELVLFCPFYGDAMWELSPMNARNNVNGIGNVDRESAYALKEEALTRVQIEMVRKIVAALKDFDNLYYEICNEPYFGGVTEAWQARIAETIAAAEKDFEHKHLIAKNIANNKKKIVDPLPQVSIFNFHYAEPEAASGNYGLDRALGDDETGFEGSAATPYRTEAWQFFLEGGAVFSNLDYTFSVGHEDGSGENDAPGCTDPAIHKQLGILRDFITSFDFLNMKPDDSVIAGGVPEGASVHVLAQPHRAWAVYMKGGTQADLQMNLPPGRYVADWIDTKTGASESKRFRVARDSGEGLEAAKGTTLTSPEYTDDIALRLVRERRPQR